MSIKGLLNFMHNKNENDIPIVTIIKNIDTDKYPWCNSALLFSVKNGKGTLTHRYCKINSVQEKN